MPQIHLPLQVLDRCYVCGGLGGLRLCGQCAETVYCSTDCQKQDWRSHKMSCKTNRIDLATFHPVFACMSESSRLHAGDVHPALKYKVVNSPNPYTPALPLPDGSSARIVRLGTSIHESEWQGDFSNWWPTGETPNIRGKLMRRIAREGKVLPLVTSSCLALMVAMYSTTTSGTDSPRVRLRYRSSPIADFGIAVGSARVTPDDQLAYILPDKSILKGQDPDDHYWIYFRTLKGEEVVLDCNLFTFNMCLVVQTPSYIPPSAADTFPLVVPVWFKDRTMTRSLPASDPPLLNERRRISVLRDNAIREAMERVIVQDDRDVAIPDETASAIGAFMSRVAGRPSTETELEFCIGSTVNSLNFILDSAIRTDVWKRFPSNPPMGIEGDPGELRDM